MLSCRAFQNAVIWLLAISEMERRSSDRNCSELPIDVRIGPANNIQHNVSGRRRFAIRPNLFRPLNDDEVVERRTSFGASQSQSVWGSVVESQRKSTKLLSEMDPKERTRPILKNTTSLTIAL